MLTLTLNFNAKNYRQDLMFNVNVKRQSQFLHQTLSFNASTSNFESNVNVNIKRQRRTSNFSIIADTTFNAKLQHQKSK